MRAACRPKFHFPFLLLGFLVLMNQTFIHRAEGVPVEVAVEVLESGISLEAKGLYACLALSESFMETIPEDELPEALVALAELYRANLVSREP